MVQNPLRPVSTSGEPVQLRHCLFPIQYDTLYEFYKKAVASFWTAEEIDLKDDVQQWREKLTDKERHFLGRVLAFFAGADGIVNENLLRRFMVDVAGVPEAICFYSFQAAIECVHSEVYSLLIHSFVTDADERDTLFRATETIASVSCKAEWCKKWIESEGATFGERLLAFACVEGIFFSSSFAAIFWMKKRALMPGLTFSNELISRDEALHTDFACALLSLSRDQPPAERAEQIVREAVAAEHQFVRDAVPSEMIGMNSKDMCTYVEFVADRLMIALGHAPIFGARNPFDWMEQISLQGKTNFFERRVGEYARAAVSDKRANHEKFQLHTDEDF